MAGSIRALDGKPNAFELRIYLGRASNGSVRHLSRRFYGSRRAAEKELARLVTEQERSPAPIPEEPHKWGPTTTINDAIEGWRENGWQDLSPKTALDYQCTWDRHIRASIGKRRIAAISTFEVETFLRGLKNNGSGQHTVRIVRIMLNRACRLARKWSGGLLSNPVTDSEMPRWKGKAPRLKPRAPTLAEAGAMLAAAEAEDLRFQSYVRVVAATGMRRGEACGLRWSDIAWDEQMVRIDEAVVAAEHGAVVKEPKTSVSVRTAHIDQGSIAILRRLRREQKGLASACELELGSDAFVFSFEPGGVIPPHPDTMTKKMTEIRKRAGVPTDVKPVHGWRYFQATELDGVISERQKQLRVGWSTTHPAMSRHYTDPVDSEGRRAADHIGNLLRTARKTAGTPKH